MQLFKPIEKYSLGMGDRFAGQGEARLQAILHARDVGTDLTPVWNKSNREHTLAGTEPASVLAEAESALAAPGFDGSFQIDAAMRTRQHIGLTPAGFLVRSFSRPDLQPSVAAALVLLGPALTITSAFWHA